VPIFGPLLDDFLQWMHRTQHYTLRTAENYLSRIPTIERWLRRQRITSLDQLTLQMLKSAYDHFRCRHAITRGAVRVLEGFLDSQEIVSEGEAPSLSAVATEVQRFSAYLTETRGLAEKTISSHRQRLRGFLNSLQFDRNPRQLRQLQAARVEAYLRRSARTNNRFSLQHVVATLRTFLGWRYAQGLLSRPLHLQIDTPRVYRGEQLPRALPWGQVQGFLQSIDRSETLGKRDFAMLYLAAAYGLRSSELVKLTLDDIEWESRALRIRQTKSRRTLHLPLTDEAANILINYLRKARSQSTHRDLFLGARAPHRPMQPTAVREVMARRIRRSGLNLTPCGTHVLRHSLAMRLMQQGVSFKTIGDALGHRDIESTSAYIRLDVDSLREVALDVPTTDARARVTLISWNNVPRIRPPSSSRHLPKRLNSWLAPSLQGYLNLKRSLGRAYRVEGEVLAHWDDFICREYPRAATVRAEMFLRWTKELVHLNPTCSRNHQRIVRNFLLRYARDHTRTFVPDPFTFPKSVPAVSPRLISQVEMARVLAAAKQLPPTGENPLRAETIRIGLLLLFCCGLRRGELLRLRLGDIDTGQKVLSIRQSKFHKSRSVPLSPTATDELKQYLAKRRKKKLPMTPESFLMWSQRRSPEVYCAKNLGSLWRQLCMSARVLNAQDHPPRLHDLRHSCAVLVLQRWYAEGGEVQAKLPYLAAYLGHVSPVSTHYYLKLTPELRQAACQRFHQRFAPLFANGGIA
jgi:site-specific recombinase XerD